MKEGTFICRIKYVKDMLKKVDMVDAKPIKTPMAVGVLSPSPPRGTPEVLSCRWGVAEIRNSKVQGTQSLDRFGPLRA
jgi:hypothetical protein